MRLVYLDNAASTPPLPEVLAAASLAAESHFANASSAHRLGAAAARALESARGELAALLGGQARDIVFTSGGTEANALGILGAARVARGRHAIVSAIEHPAVLRSVESLTEHGWQVTTVAVRGSGVIAVQDVAAAARPDTALVAVMLVNNELGTVQPVLAIARAVAAISPPPHFHVDAVQAAGFVPIRAGSLGADSLAISGHKFHGLKGAGALWLRPGARLAPLWSGGAQERGLRPGTENVPAWVALGRAAALVRTDAASVAAVAARRDALQVGILAAIPGARLTVPADAPRVPHIASITLPGLPAEPVLHALEARGVMASAGSACASRTRGPSHVLRAIGVSDDDAVLRFSFSRLNTDEDVTVAIAALRDAVAEVSSVVARPRGRKRARQ